MSLYARNLNTNTVYCQIILNPIVRGVASLGIRELKRVRQQNQSTRTLAKENQIPIIKCKRPEFNFYVGQTYKSYQEIPLASKSWFHPGSKDDYIKIRPVKSPNDTKDEIKFHNLPLNKSIVDALDNIGIDTAMTIQTKAIPPLIEGLNTVVSSETGCGKTLAFLLPMLHHVLRYKDIKALKCNTPRGLIVTPTRELAKQISGVAESLGRQLGINVKLITGGNINRILTNPPVGQIDILISSIGALKKLTYLNVYSLDEVRHIVLDEADVLLTNVFHEKVRSLLEQVPLHAKDGIDENGLPLRTQLTLTCATIPKNLDMSLDDIFDMNRMAHISTETLHHIRVPQDFLRILPSMKTMKLLEYTKEKVKKKQRAIIFVNSGQTCDFINMFLKNYNIQSISLHDDMLWKYRKGLLDEYLNGQSLILVTTFLGARGVDTVIVKNILNYDFPMDTMEYIHRCGRTGRPGTNVEECRVTNFITSKIHVKLVQRIEMAIRKGMPIPIVSYRQTAPDEEDDCAFIEENYINEDVVHDDTHEADSIPY